MATLEQVEKLRQKTNATYDEAKEALNACGDDLLDALIYLEKQGKAIPPQNGGHYSSQQEMQTKEAHAYTTGEEQKGESFGQLFHRFWKWFCKLVQKGNSNYFEVWRKEERKLSMPVTLLVILLIPGFSIILPLLLICLFLGFRYRFRGPELGKNGVNKVMDSAANAAEQFKQEVIHGGDGQDKEA